MYVALYIWFIWCNLELRIF